MNETNRCGQTILGGIFMQIKGWIATVGLGAVAGAAAVFLMPKHSNAYRVANDTMQAIKMEAGKMVDLMKKD